MAPKIEDWSNNKKKKLIFIRQCINYYEAYRDDGRLFNKGICQLLKQFYGYNVNCEKVIKWINTYHPKDNKDYLHFTTLNQYIYTGNKTFWLSIELDDTWCRLELLNQIKRELS